MDSGLEELIGDIVAAGLVVAQSLHAQHGEKIGIYFISYTAPEITIFTREPIEVQAFPEYNILVEPISLARERYQQCARQGNIGAWLAFVPSDDYLMMKDARDC